MIVLTALFCAFQFQSDEPANGRFKLNQWHYLYYHKMSQTTSEPSSITDGPINFCGEEVFLIRDFPLWQDMMGVFLKISLSRCWFCIRCHFPISILFRPGKACWYCVTKGIRSFLREWICFSIVGHFLFPSSCAFHSFIAWCETPCSPCLAQAPVMQANFFLVWINFLSIGICQHHSIKFRWRRQ